MAPSAQALCFAHVAIDVGDRLAERVDGAAVVERAERPRRLLAHRPHPRRRERAHQRRNRAGVVDGAERPGRLIDGPWRTRSASAAISGSTPRASSSAPSAHARLLAHAAVFVLEAGDDRRHGARCRRSPRAPRWRCDARRRPARSTRCTSGSKAGCADLHQRPRGFLAGRGRLQLVAVPPRCDRDRTRADRPTRRRRAGATSAGIAGAAAPCRSRSAHAASARSTRIGRRKPRRQASTARPRIDAIVAARLSRRRRARATRSRSECEPPRSDASSPASCRPRELGSRPRIGIRIGVRVGIRIGRIRARRVDANARHPHATCVTRVVRRRAASRALRRRRRGRRRRCP